MYISTYIILKDKRASIIATLLVLFSVYRGFTDLYYRAAIGEVLSFVFIPMVLAGIYRVLYEHDRKGTLLILGMFLLLITHTLSTILMIIVLIILMLIEWKKWFKELKIFWTIVRSAMIVLVVSAYYWIPMLEMMFSDRFQFSQPWTDLSKNTLDQFGKLFFINMNLSSFPFGYELWLFITIVLCLAFYWRQYFKNKFFRFISIIFFGALLFTSNLIPVKYLRFMDFIQFPWRVFILMTIFGATLIAYASTLMNSKHRKFIYIPVILTVSFGLFSVYHYYNVSMKDYKYDAFPRYSIEHSYAEFLPIDVDMDMLINNRSKKQVEISQPITIDYTQDLIDFYAYFDQDQYKNTLLEFPVIYYKGYAAYYINDTEQGFLPVDKSTNGLVRVDLGDVKSGNIRVFYNGTRIQRYSLLFSVVSILVLGAYIILCEKNRMLKKYLDELFAQRNLKR